MQAFTDSLASVLLYSIMMSTARTRPLLVLFHPHFTLAGGAGNVVIESARRLQPEYDVVVVCIRVGGDVQRLFPDIRFEELGGPLSSEAAYWLMLPFLQRRVHRLLAALNPDVLIPHVFPANWWAFIWRLFHPSTPCVWYCHEPSAFVHSHEVLSAVPRVMRSVLRLVRPVLRRLDVFFVQRCCTAIVVNSQWTKEEAERIYRRKVDAIAWPGADGDEFRPLDEKEPYLLIAGRLSYYKRVHLAIQALAQLQHRNYRLLIAGDGEERTALELLARQASVQDRVEFLGDVPLDKRAKLYARATLLLALREYESFGMVPVEAMLSGTPVVAVRSGGLLETVVDGVNGVFVPSDDPAAIARTIDGVLSNKHLYDALCCQARASAERFSWEAHVAVVRATVEAARQQYMQTDP